MQFLRGSWLFFLFHTVTNAVFLARASVLPPHGAAASGLQTVTSLPRLAHRHMLLKLLGRTLDKRRSLGRAGMRTHADYTTIPDFQDAPCNRSTYFIDWGSSGMKVFQAFRGNESEELEYLDGTTDRTKLDGVNAMTLPSQVTAILDELFGRTNASIGAGGAILATAGMRLAPTEADAIWDAVRSWSDENPGRLARCGSLLGRDLSADCETLPGKEEAKYELQSVLDYEEWESVNDTTPYGFTSSGGASMQVGFTGHRTSLRRCLSDLGELSSDFDTQRASVEEVGSTMTVLLSFLGIWNLTDENRSCETTNGQETCDYRVGGLDQMRASFDNYLISQNLTSNPCLSPNTIYEANEGCSFFGTDECVIDDYGSKISRLPAAPGPADEERKEICASFIYGFFESDLLLSRWSRSFACTAIAGSALRVALLTGFTYVEEDVVPDEASSTFAEFNASAWEVPWETAEEAVDGVAGAFMTAEMLAHFLEKLGLSPSAALSTVDADWAIPAMEERQLTAGWPTADACLI